MERIDWSKEISKVEYLCREGKTLQAIADYYGLTRQRIKQVVQRYLPTLVKEQRGKTLMLLQEQELYLRDLILKKGRVTPQHATDLSRAMASAFTRKKQNSKASGWEWTILPSDVLFPTHCPILGLELAWFSDYRIENSPSFDRVDNTKGYIPGNVIVCSWRANRIKNNGTAEEHRLIADFLDKRNADIIACQQESVR
jgi:hypothetical protein